jgi:hypothetical protein
MEELYFFGWERPAFPPGFWPARLSPGSGHPSSNYIIGGICFID